MKIRSLTFFATLNRENFSVLIESLGKQALLYKRTLEDNGISVQTIRLSSQPFVQMATPWNPQQILEFVNDLDQLISRYGFDYLSIGPASIELPESYSLIPKIVSGTKNIFCSAFLTDLQNEISLSAIHASSRVIKNLANLDENGFSNLRFSALANVAPFGPFFPASFHDPQQKTGFAIAIEAADDVLQTFAQANSLNNARVALLNNLEGKLATISEILHRIEDQKKINFYGFDVSVAPFPMDNCSLGNALECLGVNSIGDHGSLAAAAFLADTLDRGTWQRTGFNGLMLPLLEDSRLAQRSIDGTLSVKDLLMFSAVCGTGLDTIPLAGDLSVEQISSLLLDIAALSSRLNKPLTARLMPIPGKKAGDLTSFEFDFFRNGRILDLQAHPLQGLFASDSERFELNSRQSYRKATER